MKILQRLVIALALALVWSTGSGADLIHTLDGRIYEGKIAEENEDSVTVVTSFGRFQIPRAKIARVEHAPTSTHSPTSKPTPKPTFTRVPTSTPTISPTPTRMPRPEPTATIAALGTPPAPYTSEQADALIEKYEKTQVPKSKYVLAYYSKGIHALDEDKKASAIKYWTEALHLNSLLYYEMSGAQQEPDPLPPMEERFEDALEQLRLEAKRDPAAALAMNFASQRALRDVNLLVSWMRRQHDLFIALARLYADMQRDSLAIEHYLKAHRTISDQRMRYLRRVEEKTAQGDPFNLRGLFFARRIEVKGMLIDARIAQIEQILEEQYGLQPDDYLYDHE